MEALTAVSVAALTVYDMCKAVDRGMVIAEVRLLHKSGGKSGRPIDARMTAMISGRSETPDAERHRSPPFAAALAAPRWCRSADAAGRVLAGPPTARLTQPPADLSAMDGYAVRAADVPAAAGDAQAGRRRRRPAAPTAALKPGEAVRIFTGGPLPVGADTIVIQEDTEADGDKVTVLEAPQPAGTSARPASISAAGDIAAAQPAAR